MTLTSCVKLESDRRICRCKNAIQTQQAGGVHERVKAGLVNQGAPAGTPGTADSHPLTMISQSSVGNEWLSTRCQISFQWSLFRHLSYVLSVRCKQKMTAVGISKWWQEGWWGGEGLFITSNGEKRLVGVSSKQTIKTLPSKVDICNKYTDDSASNMSFTRTAMGAGRLFWVP